MWLLSCTFDIVVNLTISCFMVSICPSNAVFSRISLLRSRSRNSIVCRLVSIVRIAVCWRSRSVVIDCFSRSFARLKWQVSQRPLMRSFYLQFSGQVVELFLNVVSGFCRPCRRKVTLKIGNFLLGSFSLSLKSWYGFGMIFQNADVFELTFDAVKFF